MKTFELNCDRITKFDERKHPAQCAFFAGIRLKNFDFQGKTLEAFGKLGLDQRLGGVDREQFSFLSQKEIFYRAHFQFLELLPIVNTGEE